MPRRRLITRALLLLGVLSILLGIAVWSRYLEIERQARESHFIAAYFLAGEELKEVDQAASKNIDDLIKSYGGSESALLMPFADGLVYNPQGRKFTLEEPTSRRVSLFRSDRLISTDQKWPRWQATGRLARKFPEQEVPPLGYK